MTQEEFCKLTGIAHISGEDFASIHTLYIATGEMNKNVFCAGIKATLTEGTSEAYGTFACTPMWIDMTAKTINRLEAENRRLRTMVRDLEEAVREQEATIKDLEEAEGKQQESLMRIGRSLRRAGERGDLRPLAYISVGIMGAEASALFAVENGYGLIAEEREALDRLLEKEVTREGERPDAAAAAEADS